MSVSRFSQIWERRWILGTAALAVAGAAIIAALVVLPRTYQAGSSVMMLAPRSAARMTGGNPYLSFSPSLTLTASAVGDEVMAPGTAQRLAARGSRAAYSVTLAPYTTDTTGSVLLITVTGSSQASVRTTLRAVTAQVATALAVLQHGVAQRSRVRAVTLSYAAAPSLNVSQTGRSMILFIVPVILAALAVPVLADAFLLRRSARRRSVRAGHAPHPADS